MDKIMAEFSKFLKESEGNEDMKSALDSVVNELLTKDTLYEPMKTLREEYPVWLENNWDKVSNTTLENYNSQLDKITEICAFYESAEGDKPETQSHVFELLAQL
jgi:peroxin-19